MGFTPKLSQTLSSSSIRINQVKDLIKTCKFGGHDLSRSKDIKLIELPRFNMPYELEINIGNSVYGGKRLKTNRYHYQKVISDIAVQDIENHNDDTKTLVTKLRNWFSANLPKETIAGQSDIWTAYNQFMGDLAINLAAATYFDDETETIPISNFIKFSKDWISTFKE